MILFNYIAHIGIDMIGAVSLSCILGVCNNPNHNHGKILTWIGNNPWKAQWVSAVIIAIITVNAIG